LSGPVLTGLRIADPPEPWAALGFSVEGESLNLGGVHVELAPEAGRGIVRWGLDGIDGLSSIDGLPTEAQPPAATEAAHPNGAVAIDHVVVTTPDFARTTRALAGAGLDHMDCRSVRPER
jgi:hypothetical protein